MDGLLKMDLFDYINSYPRYKRTHLRKKLAEAHGVSEVTIRSWANGTRNHPCMLKAVEITEQLTKHNVTRFDLRPEIFGRDHSTGS